MKAPRRVDVLHETAGASTASTDSTDSSNTCGSSVAGVILQDQDTPVNLEQVS